MPLPRVEGRWGVEERGVTKDVWTCLLADRQERERTDRDSHPRRRRKRRRSAASVQSRGGGRGVPQPLGGEGRRLAEMIEASVRRSTPPPRRCSWRTGTE